MKQPQDPLVGGTADPTQSPTGPTPRPPDSISATLSCVIPTETPQEGAAGRGAALPIVPGYEVLELVGRGGMGTVYRARHLALDRIVALKMILTGGHADEVERIRFHREAQAVARLQHPNIVQIYEVGEVDGIPFFSLEYLGGGSLQQRIGNAPQPARAAARLVEQLARAMAYAHEQGVIHRDLKPANIFLAGRPSPNEGAALADTLPEDGVAKIGDFGLAKRLGEDSEQTRTGAVLGTPSFMAPEQAGGHARDVGPLADVYSLGAVLYQLITGSPPFRGTTVLDTLEQVRTQEPVPPRRLQPKVPRDLETITLKCLQKDPRARYPGCAELADDLHRFLHGEPILARPVSAPARLVRWARRHPGVAALTGAVALLLLVAAVVPSVLAWRLKRANVAAEQEEQNALQEQARAREAEALAVSQYDLAYDALGDLVLKIQLDLDEAPGGRHVRRELLEDTMQKLHRLHESPATSDRLFRRYASAHMQLGEILWGLNRRSEAEQEYRKAGEYADRAYQANPTSDKAKANIAANHNRMGDVELFYHKHLEPARTHYTAAVPLWEELANKMVAFPDGDPSLPELERINLVDTEEAVADTYDRMGIVALRFDFDYAKAEEWFGKSLAIRERHLKTHPSRAHRVAVGASYIYLGELALQHNELDKAIPPYEALLKQREATFAERRWSLKARRELADAQGKLGDALMLKKRNAEGHAQYLASRDLFQQVRAAEPDDPTYRGLVAHAHYRCGTSYLRVGDPAAARREFEDGLKLRQAVYAEVTDARQQINMQPQLMFALVRTGRYAEAAEMAANVRKNLNMVPVHLAEAGACFGLCMAAVAPGKVPDQLTPEEKRLRDSYFRQAMASFEEARAKKYDDVLFLDCDADLDVLHEVPEYVRWLESFKHSLQPTTEPARP